MLRTLAAPATVSPWGVVAAAGLVSITLIASWRLDLGLIPSISISSIRSVTQLLIAGILLVPALRSDAPLGWSWLWCGVMVVLLVDGGGDACHSMLSSSTPHASPLM